jgi:hypothetical protein
MNNAIVIKKVLLNLLKTDYPEIIDIVVNIRNDEMLPYHTEYLIYIGMKYTDSLNIDVSKMFSDTREIVYDIVGGRNGFNSVSIQTYDPNS